MESNPEKAGEQIDVLESTERWSEFNLADGTVIRIKAGIVSAVKIPDQFDEEGNPVYALNINPVIHIKHVKK